MAACGMIQAVTQNSGVSVVPEVFNLEFDCDQNY